MMRDKLSHHEVSVLRSLHAHLTGVPAEVPALTLEEYARAVLALRIKGLCGAECEGVWVVANVPYVKRVWLTERGREAAARG